MRNPPSRAPGPAQRRRGCTFTPPQGPPSEPPVFEGSAPVGWPVLQPLVPTQLTLGPTQSTHLGEGGEGGGSSVGQGRVLLGRSHPCFLHLSVWMCRYLISVPLASHCLPVSLFLLACLPPLVSLLFANLPYLLCTLVITPGQKCYLISPLAASGLYPLPFFLPGAACLPWQP